MTPDLKRIIAGKRKLRRRLSSQPIAEKLAMLDALRERTLLLRGAERPGDVNETEGEYRIPSKRSNDDLRH